MKTLALFDVPFPQRSRWFPGDQYLRSPIRKLLAPFRGRGPGGLAKVTFNLCLGLDKLGVEYQLIRRPALAEPIRTIFGLLHGPLDECRSLAQAGPCIVGPGILNAAAEWPDLFSSSRAVYSIQNCEWAAAMYRPIYGDRVKIWSMGVDEERFAPRVSDQKRFDFLIYDKIRWPDVPAARGLLERCQEALREAGASTHYIRYGRYPRGQEESYHEMLRQSRAMLFLSENETQGFAYNEALSLGVPVLAWNCGKWCDPSRFRYGLDEVEATSIPYWDERCGVDFRGIADFSERLGLFLHQMRSGFFAPRDYVMENLTIRQGARRYLDLIAAADQEASDR